MKATQEIAPHGNNLLDNVRIITERESGLVEAYVPMHLINREEVAVDQEHANELAHSIKKESSKNGNIGQLTPVLLAQVEGSDQFYILDGFHRCSALNALGKEEIYATIKTDCTFEDVIDIRIVSAKSHKSVKFSRIVEWVEQAWDETEWSDRVGLSLAFQLAFLKTATGGRAGLDKEEAESIRQWVQEKCQQWEVSPNRVQGFLRTAQHADPKLVKSTRERKSGHKLEAVTPDHLKEIARLLPDDYPLQNRIAETAIKHALTIPQTSALSLAISKAKNEETIDEYIESKIWERMDSGVKTLTKKRYEPIDPESKESYNNTLADKFYDDQINLAQLQLENAFLLGRYTPKSTEAHARVNSVLFATDGESLDEPEELPEDEIVIWDQDKIMDIAKKCVDWRLHLEKTVRYKYPFSPEEAEDIVSLVFEKLLTRVNDGRLPKSYESDTHLRALLTKMTITTSIDTIRAKFGRHGQKPSEYSMQEEDEDGRKLEDVLGQEDETFLDVDDKDTLEFVRYVLPYLNSRNRQIIVLYGVFNLTLEEVADVIGTTFATIVQNFKDIKRTVVGLMEHEQVKDLNVDVPTRAL